MANNLVKPIIVALVITIVFGWLGSLSLTLGILELIGVFIAGLVAGWMVKDLKNGAITGFIGPAIGAIIWSIIAIAINPLASAAIGFAAGVGGGGIIAVIFIIGAIVAGIIGLVGGLIGAYIGKSKK